MFPGMDGSDGEWKSDSSLTVDSVTVDHILTCTDVEIVARGEAARRQTNQQTGIQSRAATGLSPTSVDEKKFKKKFWQFAGISGWEEGNIHVNCHLVTNTYGGTMRNQGNLVLFVYLFFYNYFIKIN